MSRFYLSWAAPKELSQSGCRQEPGDEEGSFVEVLEYVVPNPLWIPVRRNRSSHKGGCETNQEPCGRDTGDERMEASRPQDGSQHESPED